MGDYYTADLSRLNGQPKRTIANYVEQNGILVPKRFDTLAELRRFCSNGIARSEHTIEYEGASGLLDSPWLSELKDIDNEEEILEKELNGDYTRACIEFYCEYLGISIEDFREEISFSFWEYVPGFFVNVIADSAIKDRVHVMSSGKGEVYYSLVQGEKISENFLSRLSSEQESEIIKWARMYREINSFDHFDSNHCPVIELKKAFEDGKTYFLQYHRTRDFSPPDFVLDRQKRSDEVEAMFVRGKTQKGGIDQEVTVFYRDEDYVVSDEETASFGSKLDQFDEVMNRKRKLRLIRRDDSIKAYLARHTDDHGTRSELFKPEISAVVEPFSLFSFEEWKHFIHNGGSINVHVESDGKRCLVRRLN